MVDFTTNPTADSASFLAEGACVASSVTDRPGQRDGADEDGARSGDLLARLARTPEGSEALSNTLAEIYDRYGNDLYGWALWRTGDPDNAADAVQELFVRLVDRRQQIHSVRSPRAFLYTTLRGVCVDQARRLKRHWRLREATPVEELLLEAPTSSPELQAEASQLSRSIAALPTKQREVLYLRSFVGLTFAEIGAVIGAPTFTAASRHRLALKRLRTFFHVTQTPSGAQR